MKKLLSILTLLLFFLIGNSATYYVSDAGNDSNSGLSTLLPWKSITKVNSATYLNGDHILFRRGDTFIGTLTLAKSSVSGTPIVYGAYGTGAKPIITSMQTLSGWTLHSGKIYKVSGIPANCNVVTVNGFSTEKGHWPAVGFAVWDSYTFTLKNILSASNYSGTVTGTTLFTTTTAHGLSTGHNITIQGTTSYNGYHSVTVVNSTQFYISKTYVSSQAGTLTFNTAVTDSDLPASPSFMGADLVLYKSNWTIDRSQIVGHSTHTLNYSSGSANAMQTSGGQKYLIQNDIDCLTYQNAWYCDGTSFYMYFENNDPENYVVKAGASDYTVYMSGKNYNTLRDIQIEGGNLAGIYLTSTNGFSFRNSTLKNIGLLGITATSSTTVTTVDSCAISYVNGTGISINSAGSYIGHTTFDRCGQFAGMGGAGGGSHYGIYTKGVGNITEYNTITNTGYIPIFWESSGAICRYNIIDTYATLGLVDGGGIYTFESLTPQTAKKCYGNVIMNSPANGLYSDGIANNIEFYNNIVVNVDKWGIHMNMPSNNSVHDNTFYDCGLAGIDVTNQTLLGVYYTASGNSVYSNLFIQASATQKFYSLQDAQANNVLTFGTSNNNTFIADNSATTVFYNLYVLPTFHSNSYTWANWKAFTGLESTSSYLTKDLATLTFIYNDTHAAKTIAITGTKTDLGGANIYQNSVTLQPYTSILLLPAVVPEVKKIIKFGGVAIKKNGQLISTH
jgi:hypothetical protein